MTPPTLMVTHLQPHRAFLPLRIYLCFSTLVVALISLAAPTSLNARLIAQSGASGLVVSWLLGCFALIGLADALINDILPARFTIPLALQHRHLGYIGIASLNVAFLYAMARSDAVTWLAARYALDATFCTLVAWGHIRANQVSRNYPYVERRQARQSKSGGAA